MNGNPAQGLAYFIEGFKLLNKPGIRLFVLIPLIINIALFTTASYFSFQYFNDGLDLLLAKVPDWLSFIRWILMPIFVLTVGTFIFFIFNMIANFIASPFNAILAERVEIYLCGEDDQVNLEENGFSSVINAIPQSLKREIQKLKYYFPRFILLTILSLIPGVNILVFIFAAWMMAIQYLDYAMDNHQVVFKDMLAFLRTKRLTSLGFGAIVMLCLMVPVLNFVVIPAAVAGSSIFWVREFKESNKNASSLSVK